MKKVADKKNDIDKKNELKFTVTMHALHGKHSSSSPSGSLIITQIYDANAAKGGPPLAKLQKVNDIARKDTTAKLSACGLLKDVPGTSSTPSSCSATTATPGDDQCIVPKQFNFIFK